MSLRVYLPLNGSITDSQSAVTMTNSNASFTNGSEWSPNCYFNGSNSYLLSNTGPLSNSTTDWTFSCWFKPVNFNLGCLLSSRTEVNTSGIAIFYYGERFLFDDGVRWEFPSNQVKPGIWNHLTFIRKGGTGKYFYVNGKLVHQTTTTGSPTTAGSRFSIGGSQTAQGTVSGNWLNGYLREVRIYDNAIGSTKIFEDSMDKNNRIPVWIPLRSSVNNIGYTLMPTSSIMIPTYSNVTFGSSDGGVFNGSSSYVQGTYPATSSITFSLWVNFGSSIGSGHLFDARSSDASAGYQPMYITPTSIQVGHTPDSFPTFNYTWQTNTWYHIVVTHDTSKVTLYVNGTTINSSTTGKGASFGTIQFNIGCRCSKTSFLPATVKNVMIFNTCLSAREVTSLYQIQENNTKKLKYWYPFNGDIKNYAGTFTHYDSINSPGFDNNGKIGKALSLTTDGQGVNGALVSDISTYSKYTMCAWIYLTAQASFHSTAILSTGDWNYAANQMVFGLYDYSDGYRVLLVPNRSGWSQGITLPNKIQLNQWYHIAITYDGSVTKGYVNGEYIGQYTGGGITSTSNSSDVYIGRATYYTGFTLKGKINDVRIYSDALSASEIKGISRALAIHHRLNNIRISDNLLPNVQTGSGWSYSSFDSNNCIYTRSTTATSESYVLAPLSTIVTAGVPFTLSCWAKSNGYVSSMDIYKYNSSTSNIQSSTGLSVTTEWQFYTWTFTPQATETVYIRFDNNGTTVSGTEATLYIRQPKLEVGSFSTVQEEDCSGFGNHGLRIGNFRWSTDTPIYDYSQTFNGTNNATIMKYDASRWQTGFTMNIWFKKTAVGSEGYETIIGGPSGFEMDTRKGTETPIRIYMATARNNAGGDANWPVLSLGQWYMITLVNDGTNEKYYVNGQLRMTIAKQAMPSGEYYLGAWSTASGQSYYGNLSDFRFYATPLSDSEVLSLYNGQL